MLKDIGVSIDGYRLLLRGELSGITRPGSLRTIVGGYHHCRAALVEQSRCFVAK